MALGFASWNWHEFPLVGDALSFFQDLHEFLSLGFALSFFHGSTLSSMHGGQPIFAISFRICETLWFRAFALVVEEF